MANDLRIMTEEERRSEGGKEIIDLGKKKITNETVEVQFLVKADEVWYKHVSNVKPFCKICANREFLAEVLEKRRFIKDFQGDELPADRATVKIATRDFTAFGPETFDLIGERPITEKVVVNGMAIPKKVEKYLEFKCKVCRSGSSIQVPIDFVYGQEKPKTKSGSSPIGDMVAPGALKADADNTPQTTTPNIPETNKDDDLGFVSPPNTPPSQS